MGPSSWILYASIAALSLVVADVCLKLAAGRISSSFGVLLYGTCTFLTGLCWVLWDYSHGHVIRAELSGILAAVGVGVAFSAVTVSLYATFTAGAPVSVASPFIRLSGVVVVSLIGLVFMKEMLTIRYVIGMVLTVVGLYLIVSR
jgi:drug/metabolite transporter (DMT)-like permease